MRDDREENNDEETSSNHTRAKRNLRKRNVETTNIKSQEPAKRKSGMFFYLSRRSKKKSLNDFF